MKRGGEEVQRALAPAQEQLKLLLDKIEPHYTSAVDAQGQLTTPFSTFDVMRVQVLLERTIGLLTTQLRTFAFVTECFGTVASVTSQDNEAGTEFTEVSELRRLTP